MKAAELTLAELGTTGSLQYCLRSLELSEVIKISAKQSVPP